MQSEARSNGSPPDASPMEIVIMGCGRIGSAIIASLAAEGHTVHVLDTQRDTFDRLPVATAEDGRIIPIIGDGTLEADLRKAAIQDAEVFIAVSGRDLPNILAAQVAKHVFEVPKVICRVNDPVRQEMYSELGLTTISATHVIAQTAMRAVHA